MTYLSIVNVLPTVDGGQHVPSLEKQTVVPSGKQRMFTIVLITAIFFTSYFHLTSAFS